MEKRIAAVFYFFATNYPDGVPLGHESICTPMDFDGQVFTDDDPSGEYPVPRDDIMVKNSLIPRCLPACR